MTETKERTLEDVRAELGRAEGALVALEAEARNHPEAMKRAADDARGMLTKSAVEGKPLRADSDLARLRRRGEDLPALEWAARVRTKELRIEMWSLEMEQADWENRKASEELAELKRKEREIAEKKAEALHRANYAYDVRWKERNRWIGQERRELEALRLEGPKAPAPTNPLKRRPF